MTVSLKGVGAITLFVEDLERSRLFYQDVFGLQMIYEDEDSAAFEFESTIINLLSIPANDPDRSDRIRCILHRSTPHLGRAGRRRAERAVACAARLGTAICNQLTLDGAQRKGGQSIAAWSFKRPACRRRRDRSAAA